MLRLKLKNYLLSALLVMAPVFAVADEVTDVVNDVAAKLVQQLPMDKKIALKSLSPDKTGLPEDFLRKLTSDLEAALLTASDFEINLANRATMEDVWQEAVEFNNADFDELFISANADVMLMMSPRAISTGVEIAMTAYSLTGDNIGKTLASSGSVLIPIDLQANLGVDVNDLNKQMAKVLADIEKVGQTGGLIPKPNTYAEFYHNARLLQQRGEVDLAMRNYEQAVAQGYPFVDPVLDLLILSNSRYGYTGSKLYFEKKIQPIVSDEIADFGSLYFQNISLSDIYTETDLAQNEDVFLPNLVLWLNQNINKLLGDSSEYQERGYVSDYEFLRAARIVLGAYREGRLQNFFIDKVRASDFVSVWNLQAVVDKLNRFEYQVLLIDYKRGTSSNYASWDCGTSDSSKVLKEFSGKEGARLINDPDFIGGRPYCRGNSLNEWERLNYSETGGYFAERLQLSNEALCSNFSPNMDRVLFGDICDENQYYGIGRLLITDDVDTERPILITLGFTGFDEFIITYRTDISVDGTYISSGSAPIASYDQEGYYYSVDHPNSWFWAPGLLQSSLQGAVGYVGEAGSGRPIPKIFSVEYTDKYGQIHELKNGMLSEKSVKFVSDGEQKVASDSVGGREHYAPSFRAINQSQFQLRSLFQENWSSDKLREFNTAIKNTERVFKSFDIESRRAIQSGLSHFNRYRGTIDGKWGADTEFAIKAVYASVVNHYGYVPTELTSETISRSTFINFWNELMDCNGNRRLLTWTLCEETSASAR